ncbi:MAG: MYXO-CTERM domain-containing protein [Myxococcota bacterium]|jgi:MYXO-CTERM domain-containing protein
MFETLKFQVGIATLGVLIGMAPASASLWEDATEMTIGSPTGWSNKVELADIDGDGWVDVLFANGGNYASAGGVELNRVFLNGGPGQSYIDISGDVFGNVEDSARVIKVRDLNADGVPDIVVGTTWQTRSRLFLGLGAAEFVEVTNSHTPVEVGSIGDIDIGDVDGDGDLDMVLADWGAGNPQTNDGGKTRLWLNNGFGAFTSAPTQMPDVLVRWSWDLEFADVDNDLDLDILVSCKSCSGSKLFLNDGDGVFTDASENLPQFTNNYDFEVMDVDGDGDVDLVTINDGPGLREHLFLNDGSGVFSDATDDKWAGAANAGEDDNALVFFDYESDGDADFLIGSLSGADRLLVNDGTGSFTLIDDGFSAPNTPGTLGVLVADLNGDKKLDVVHAQGETASDNRVYLGDEIGEDTAPPTIGPITATAEPGSLTLRLRVHDRKTPIMDHDFSEVVVRWSTDGGEEVSEPLIWTGEALWRVTVEFGGGTFDYRVCATDAAENEACSETATATIDEPVAADEDPMEDAGPAPDSGAEVMVAERPVGAEISASDVVETQSDVSGAEVGEAIDAGTTPEEDIGSTTETTSDSGGCSSSGAPAGSAPAFWLMLAAGAWFLRRRLAAIR